jgi:hypothetical protein
MLLQALPVPYLLVSSKGIKTLIEPYIFHKMGVSIQFFIAQLPTANKPHSPGLPTKDWCYDAVWCSLYPPSEGTVVLCPSIQLDSTLQVRGLLCCVPLLLMTYGTHGHLKAKDHMS